jgi:di/tricarboxylate transporter
VTPGLALPHPPPVRWRMPADALLTAIVVVSALGVLVATRYPPDVVFGLALTVLLVSGVVDPARAFAGFSNEGVITVAILYVVVSGLRETGGVHWISRRLLGKPKTLEGAQVRLTGPVAFFSAFLNNTPIVAMLVPAVREWAKGLRLPVSKLMMPLSYAAMLGGTCTLVGTSTTLVVHGLLIEQRGFGLRFFEIAWVGVPTAIVGLAFVVATARWLLPDRIGAIEVLADTREYTVEMTVDGKGPLDGKTVAESGLQDESGLQLIEVHRDGEIYPAVSPQQRLHAGDRLVLAGAVGSVVELQRRHGLTPATDQVFKLDSARSERALIEAVVSDSSPLVGRSIRHGRFRTRYGAVVIAVARNGVRVPGNIRDIVLRTGDTLLLEAEPGFAVHHHSSRDFFLVSALPDSNPLRFDRAAIAIVTLALMVGSAALGILSMLQAALIAAAVMLITRCTGVAAARRSVDLTVIAVIAFAFGVGQAVDVSGLADVTAQRVMDFAGASPVANLVAIYALTALFSAVITNNAAAVLVFPITLSLARDLGVDPMPFVIALVLAASASFATPIGYQTNLMVYGPGGYRFTDYLRVGVPLTIVTGIVAVLVIPRVWPF